MQSNVSDTLTDIPFSPSYMRVVKIISVFVTRWVLRKDATLDHCFQTVSFYPHKHFPDLPNTLACFLLTLLLKMCLPLNHIKNISICHERLTCMWIFLGVNSFLSSSPFCFINYCHSKRSPGVVKLLNFWFFEWLPFSLFSLKVSVKGPKCEWRRLLLVQNLPTFFHPAEKLTEQNWQGCWVCPDISATVFTVESGFWQSLNKGTSPAEPRLPFISQTWHCMAWSWASLHLSFSLE